MPDIAAATGVAARMCVFILDTSGGSRRHGGSDGHRNNHRSIHLLYGSLAGQQTCCVFELGEKIVVSQKKAIDGAVENFAGSYKSRQERRSGVGYGDPFWRADSMGQRNTF